MEVWSGLPRGAPDAGDALRPALDLLALNQLQEWAAPGTLARRASRMEREHGQERLYDPILLD